LSRHFYLKHSKFCVSTFCHSTNLNNFLFLSVNFEGFFSSLPDQLGKEEAERKLHHPWYAQGPQEADGLVLMVTDSSSLQLLLLPLLHLFLRHLLLIDLEIIRTGHEDKEEKEADTGNEDARDDEGEAPVGVDKGPGDEGAHNVAHRGVGVPDAHDEAPLGLTKPVAHDGHEAGPAGGLEEALDHQQADEEGQAVDVEVVGEAVEDGQSAGGYLNKRGF